MESFSKVVKLLPTKNMTKDCNGNNVIFNLWFKFFMHNVTGRGMLPDSTVYPIVCSCKYTRKTYAINCSSSYSIRHELSLKLPCTTTGMAAAHYTGKIVINAII